jgi:O-antigen ligase
MNTSGSRIIRLATAQAPMVTMGVIACFAFALAGVWKLGLPIWSLLIPAAMAVYALAVVQNPTIGLIVVLCITYVPIHLGNVSFLQLVGMGTCSLILLWALYQHRGIRLELFHLPLLIIGLLICTSFMYARDVTRVAVHLRIWAAISIFVLLMTNLVTRHDIFKKVIWTMIVMSSVNAVAGLSQFATATESNFRAKGLLEHTNEISVFSVTAFPLAFYQFLYRSDRLRWLALGLSGLLAGGIIVSASRTGTFALIVVFAAIMISERRRIVPIMLVLALAIGCMPLLPDYFYSRVGNLADDAFNTIMLNKSEQLTPRGKLNKAAIAIWLTRPVLGVGIGNFGLYFVEQEYNQGFKRSNKVPPHNAYLQALAEMGVIGLLNLIGLLAVVLWHLVRTRRISYHDFDLWQYHGGVQILILAVVINCTTGINLLKNELWLLLCLAPISHRVAVASTRSGMPSPEPSV